MIHRIIAFTCSSPIPPTIHPQIGKPGASLPDTPEGLVILRFRRFHRRPLPHRGKGFYFRVPPAYKKNGEHQKMFSIFGTPEGTRTPDLLIRSQSLYPTELPAHTTHSLALRYNNMTALQCQGIFANYFKLFYFLILIITRTRSPAIAAIPRPR